MTAAQEPTKVQKAWIAYQLSNANNPAQVAAALKAYQKAVAQAQLENSL